MDQGTLVNTRINETRVLIDRLAEEHQLFASDAFWIEFLEDGEWELHIVAPAVDEIGILGGYDALILTLKAHPEIQLADADIRPQRTDDPVVVETLDFIRRYPASEAFRLGGIFLNGHFVQRAYVYPVLLDGKAGPEIASESLISH